MFQRRASRKFLDYDGTDNLPGQETTVDEPKDGDANECWHSALTVSVSVEDEEHTRWLWLPNANPNHAGPSSVRDAAFTKQGPGCLLFMTSGTISSLHSRSTLSYLRATCQVSACTKRGFPA